MRVLIVTQTAELWSDFEAALSGHDFVKVADREAALAQVRKGGLDLVIWDHADRPLALRDEVIDVMMIDAKIHQTMVSEMDDDDFHEATEGLGLLPPISPARDAEAVEALMKSLEAACF